MERQEVGVRNDLSLLPFLTTWETDRAQSVHPYVIETWAPYPSQRFTLEM